MFPTLGDSTKSSKPLDKSNSFLSRMLGRSPSKGSINPSPPGGELSSNAAAGAGGGSGSLKAAAGVGVLGSGPGPAPQGGLKGALSAQAAGSVGSSSWSIGSSKTEQQASSRSHAPLVPSSSAKTLEDAATSAKSTYMAKVNALLQGQATAGAGGGGGSAGHSPAQRVPSATRLTPVTAKSGTLPAGSGGSFTNSSSNSSGNNGTASAKSSQSGPVPADPSVDDVMNMTGEQLRHHVMIQMKTNAALKQHLEDISGSGKPPSGTGMQTAAAAPASATPAAAPRASVAPFSAAHRSPSLVVEFAEPRHQQRPSMIAHTLEQIKSGLAPAVSSRPRESVLAPGAVSDHHHGSGGLAAMEIDDEEDGFIEEGDEAQHHHAKPAASGTSSRSMASIDKGPSLDPIQARKATDTAAAAMKAKQPSVSDHLEAEEKKAQEAKRRQDEKTAIAAAAAVAQAAAAHAATAAVPSPERNLKRRYKLLSVFPLLPPAMRREEWSLQQFSVEKRLHKGYASEVYKARDIQSGELLAVKVYNLNALGELNKVQLIREIRLHGSFAHRNIIELFVAFQEEHRVVLAQKYADGGDLLKALHQAGGRLTEHSAVSMVIHPLLSCMVYLHGKGIIHRDIKPENILFDQGILKVADFGLALNSNEEHAVTRAGTLHYMAPEVVKNPLKDHPDDFKNEARYHYNVVVDSWAVGCLAYELIVGYPPFTANTQQQVVHNINNLKVQCTKRMSDDCFSFISAALERNPVDRATSGELIRHPWIVQHMRRNSSRTLTLQPSAAPVKAVVDFAPGSTVAKNITAARRAADTDTAAAAAGPTLRRQGSIMAPF